MKNIIIKGQNNIKLVCLVMIRKLSRIFPIIYLVKIHSLEYQHLKIWLTAGHLFKHKIRQLITKLMKTIKKINTTWKGSSWMIWFWNLSKMKRKSQNTKFLVIYLRSITMSISKEKLIFRQQNFRKHKKKLKLNAKESKKFWKSKKKGTKRSTK